MLAVIPKSIRLKRGEIKSKNQPNKNSNTRNNESFSIRTELQGKKQEKNTYFTDKTLKKREEDI